MKKEIYKFKLAKINDIFFAPYYKNSKRKKFRLSYNDRKPNTGMLLKAKNKWNINFKKSYFIGDKYTDKIAGNNVGVKFYYKKKISLYNQVKKIIL